MITNMKSPWTIRTLLAAAVVLAPVAARSEEFVTNRFSFSARFGFNVSARFKGNAGSLPPAAPRTTPEGDPYNYDDGYVLTDVSGNAGGQTWYWGYDNSASQISGNNILLSRSTPSGDFTSPSLDDSPSFGGELAYHRLIAVRGRVRFGVESAITYANLSLSDSSSFSGSVTRVTDAYLYTPGTTPPAATPSSPYQGSFQGPGFVIGDTPLNSSTTTVPGGLTVSGRRSFDADIWGWRVGPYVDIPLGEKLNLLIYGGVALGWLRSDAAWDEIITLPNATTINSSGGRSDDGLLWGGYAGANVSWDFHHRWSLIGGVQYQNLGQYEQSFGGRAVDVDLRNGFFATAGLSWKF